MQNLYVLKYIIGESVDFSVGTIWTKCGDGFGQVLGQVRELFVVEKM